MKTVDAVTIPPEKFRKIWDEDVDRETYPGHWIGKTNCNSANRPLIYLSGENRSLRKVMRELFYPHGGHRRDPCPHEHCVHPNHRYSQHAV